MTSRNLGARLKAMKSHKSKYATNMFYSEGALFYADAPVKKVVKYSVEDQDTLSRVYTKQRSAFAFPLYRHSKIPGNMNVESTVLISDGIRLKIVDLENKSEKNLPDLDDEEGCVGAAATHVTGAVFFTTIHLDKENLDIDQGGCLYSLGRTGKCTKLFEGLCVPEGLCFNKDYSRLFGMDLSGNRVLSCNVSENNIKHPETFLSWSKEALVPGATVRGMLMDEDDHLWMCCSGTGKVIQIDVEKKSVLKEITLPKARELSSLCFGGPDLRELFIATSYAGLPQNELTRQINAGYIFVAKGYQDIQGKVSLPVRLEIAQD